MGMKVPDADMPSIDPVFEALSGGALVQGGGHEPFGYTGGPNDNGTSLLGALAAMAALYRRRAQPRQSAHWRVPPRNRPLSPRRALGRASFGLESGHARTRSARAIAHPSSLQRQATIGCSWPSPRPSSGAVSESWTARLPQSFSQERYQRLGPERDRRSSRRRSRVAPSTTCSNGVRPTPFPLCAPKHSTSACWHLRDAGSPLVRESDHPEFGRLIISPRAHRLRCARLAAPQ